MTSLIQSATLLLALGMSLFLISLFNLKVIKPTLETLSQTIQASIKAEDQRAKILTQTINLLASKDPMTYQVLQATTPEPAKDGVYNGPYVTGEEYQQLLDAEARMAQLWKSAEEGLEN
jgi:hypothetical protein